MRGKRQPVAPAIRALEVWREARPDREIFARRLFTGRNRVLLLVTEQPKGGSNAT